MDYLDDNNIVGERITQDTSQNTLYCCTMTRGPIISKHSATLYFSLFTDKKERDKIAVLFSMARYSKMIGKCFYTSATFPALFVQNMGKVPKFTGMTKKNGGVSIFYAKHCTIKLAVKELCLAHDLLYNIVTLTILQLTNIGCGCHVTKQTNV
jgi:hypothetical protein